MLVVAVVLIRAESLPVEILPNASLPIRIDNAIVNNLEHRADFDYSVTNMTQTSVWNFEVVMFALNPKGRIVRKLPICFDRVIETEAERCRYYPPGETIEPNKSEDIGVILDERIKSDLRIVVALREVRTDNGIWQVSDVQLARALARHFHKSPHVIQIKKTRHISVSDSDKLAVIGPTLDLALARKQIPDYGLIKDKDRFILSTENVPIGADEILKRFKVSLMNDEQIQSRANSEGDFLVLRFGKIVANGNKLFVVLTNTWVKGETSQKRYLSGGGMFVEFRKSGNRWIGRNVGGWIS